MVIAAAAEPTVAKNHGSSSSPISTTERNRRVVERFYYRGWNKQDEEVLRECLHPNVRFRSPMSLKKKHRGADSVVEYTRILHKVLGSHTRRIEDLVADDNNKCAARIQCHGIHKSDFFGVQGTGLEVQWWNAAFFTFDEEGLITEYTVIGDIDSLKRQIGAPPEALPF